MTCQTARALLPEYAGGDLPGAGDLEVHLAACSNCSSELARYREVAQAVAALRLDLDTPSELFVPRLLSQLPAHRIRDDLRRIAQDHPRAQVAAVSLGGAALGAAAIALLWWRAARRTLGAAVHPAT